LRRIKENEYPSTPYTSKGIIYIDKPADKNEGYFGGILAHESNHMVHDPITFFNYFNCIQEIKKRLDTKDKMENLLANVASDLIIEYNQVMKIIKSNNSREKKYVQLAAIFKPLYEKDQKNMPKYIMQISGKGADGKSKTINIPMTEEEKQQMEKRMKLMPINPGKE